MKEIKFRIWDGGKMHYVDLWWNFTDYLNSDMPAMQYTGLKDKKGKDVYEGDYDEDFQVVTWCDRKHGWTMSTYDFPTKDFICCHCYNCEGDYEIDESPFEIIGNIYETPESSEK